MSPPWTRRRVLRFAPVKMQQLLFFRPSFVFLLQHDPEIELELEYVHPQTIPGWHSGTLHRSLAGLVLRPADVDGDELEMLR